MQYKQVDNTYIIYVEQDEDIMATLTQFCKDQKIINGQLSGIGAIKMIDLGVYDLEKKEYVRCLLYTSPSPRDLSTSRMPSSA